MRQRPLSPHLGIYRFAYTMATSIAHRASGLVMSAGLIVLTWWLLAASTGPDSFAAAVAVLGSGVAQWLLAAWLLAFCYHLCNGLRHLNWDLGRGLEKEQARRSAAVVVAATLLLAVLFGYVAFFAGVPR